MTFLMILSFVIYILLFFVFVIYFFCFQKCFSLRRKMSKSITELTSYIEELEKRIRAISLSQSTLTQVIAIRDCITEIKTYLSELNTTLDNMEESASDAELEALKSRVDVCEEDISLLQTTLASAEDDLQTLQSDLSDTNQTVGQHTTSITNLQTTQTNLQATQSSQASTINSLNTRLSTCENNVNILTGGVDLSELENRIQGMEKVNDLFQTYIHKKFNFHNATPKNFTLFSRIFEYVCKPNVYVYQEFKLSYEFTGSGTMTISVLQENENTGESFTIDLAQYPTGYTFTREFCPEYRTNNLILKCVASDEITYKSLDVTMHGEELFIFEGNQDLKVATFNDITYITRYYDDHITYGKFDLGETIDIDNLPNSRPYNDYYGWHQYIIYGPYPQSQSPWEIFDEVRDDSIMRISGNDNVFYASYIQETVDAPGYHTMIAGGSFANEITLGYYTYNYFPTIYKHEIALKCSEQAGLFTNFQQLSVDSVKEWLHVVLIRNNSCQQNDLPIAGRYCKVIALGDDGWWYYISKASSTLVYASKICKGGNFLTAYLQSDSKTINVYVSFNNYVEQYKLTIVSNSEHTSEFVKKIDNCTCVYELLNGDTIYKTSTGKWIMNEFVTILPEETAE